MTDRSDRVWSDWPRMPPSPLSRGERWTPAERAGWARELEWVEARLREVDLLDDAADTDRWVVLVRRRRRAKRLLAAIDALLAP
jgi:hypothetical protein